MEQLENKLKELRNDNEVTQELLAKEVGVSRQTIIAIEGGGYLPSVLLAMKIAKYFGKTVEEVFRIKK